MEMTNRSLFKLNYIGQIIYLFMIFYPLGLTWAEAKNTRTPLGTSNLCRSMYLRIEKIRTSRDTFSTFWELRFDDRRIHSSV